jgi:hypothetical protein
MYLESAFPLIFQNAVSVFRKTQACLLERDKQLHMRWSFWMTLAANVLWPPLWAIAAVFALGLTKEFWDHRYGSGFCFIDIACNLIGIAGAIVVVFFLPEGVFG